MRILVDLPDDTLAKLAAVSKRRKASRAALIREAVGRYVAAEAPMPPAEDETFGAWGKFGKDAGEDGLAFQRRLRAEW
jgi:metal-responsive CopG/Arc/MetJ family transcriptional regulator